MDRAPSRNKAIVDVGSIPAQPEELISSGEYNILPTIIGHNEHESRVGDFFSGQSFASFDGQWGTANSSKVRAYIADRLGPSADGVRTADQGAEELLSGLYSASNGFDTGELTSK